MSSVSNIATTRPAQPKADAGPDREKPTARAAVKSAWWIVLIIAVAAGLGAGMYALVSQTIGKAVRDDAAATAHAWANYFARNFDGIENVLSNGQLSDRQREFISASAEVGQVFRFKLFDSKGRLVLVSDQAQLPVKEASLREHNPQAVAVLDSAEEIVAILETDGKADRPAVYAEAYVPVRSKDGEVLGIVEVYVDQTDMKTMFQRAFFWLGLLLAGSIAIAFAIPALAFAMRNAQALRAAAAMAEIESGARAAAERQALELSEMNTRVSALNDQLVNNMEQLQNAQVELLRKGKFAQLGQLTATVAHELRNPLAAVRTSAFLLERKSKGKGLGLEPQLERINNGITRCDDIISQLLDFARTKSIQPEALPVDDWLAKVVENEAQNMPEQVAVECRLGLGDIQARFDPARMSRVVINLLSNAAEATCGRSSEAGPAPVKSPRIIVSTRSVPRGIELTVADNGPGIPHEHLNKILEPLFTTKSFGTGLGLPAVQKILEQHGGGLDVRSQPGQGAEFTAWWPVSAELKEAV